MDGVQNPLVGRWSIHKKGSRCCVGVFFPPGVLVGKSEEESMGVMLIDDRPGTSSVGGFTPMAAARCKVPGRERVMFVDHRVEAGRVLKWSMGFEMVTEMTDPIEMVRGFMMIHGDESAQ